MELAQEFGITSYPTPAGGCLLTDKGYSSRLKDLFDHQESYTEAELHLLKHGRHLRLDKNTKIIVGRTQKDNEKIKNYYNPSEDTLIKVKNFPGPTVLMLHGGSKEMMILAASICAGYSKAPDATSVQVGAVTPNGNEIFKVIGIPPADIKHFLI
jgi:hypothetical protein